MQSAAFLAGIPKVELHVHLEGSVRPETLLMLAKRNHVALPADTVEGLREWYTFRDFDHFVKVYVTASSCIRTADDLELIAREFVDGQVEQNVLHSEVTYTAETIQRLCGISWADQLSVLHGAREYASDRAMSLEFIIDIVREVPEEVGLEVAKWAIAGAGEGVCALGLSGVEADTPASRHKEAFRLAREAGLPISTHAGETSGPQAIWDCVEVLGANRIGHGTCCLRDPKLAEELLAKGIHVEVCPSSNVCLGVVPAFEAHPIQAMIEAGLSVSVNSDDPPMFNTTLTEEWQRCASTFSWDRERILDIQLQTIDASFVSRERKAEMETAVHEYFARSESGFSDSV